MKRYITVLLALGMLPWAGLHAQSQTAQTTFMVTARVNAVCAVTANDLAFGAYNPKASSPHQANTLLRATCTPGSSYQIGLDQGQTPGATVDNRAMRPATGTQNLTYQLYSDSARGSVWGNTQGTNTVTGVGTGLTVDHTVFGAILPLQSIPAGDYGDIITVRIYY